MKLVRLFVELPTKNELCVGVISVMA